MQSLHTSAPGTLWSMEEREPEYGLQDPLEYQEGNSYIDRSSIVHINLFIENKLKYEVCSLNSPHVNYIHVYSQSDKHGVFTCASNHKCRIDLQSIGPEPWVLKKFLE